MICEDRSPHLFLFYRFSQFFLTHPTRRGLSNCSLSEIMSFCVALACVIHLATQVCPLLCECWTLGFLGLGTGIPRSKKHGIFLHCFALQWRSVIRFLISKWKWVSVGPFYSFPKLSWSLISFSKIIRLICLLWHQLTERECLPRRCCWKTNLYEYDCSSFHQIIFLKNSK